ncbi:hypothetical protein EV401DRAFT_2082018 [Pisolithus croceorrhizus]|nr:hypothetical protein EV401DRAFT_2082018 [Pisolithus croceorrhizus]
MRKFYVVVVYLEEDMMAPQYVVIQIGQDNDELAEGFFSICHRDFDITEKVLAIIFVREMYNPMEESNDLAKDLDADMTQALYRLKLRPKTFFLLARPMIRIYPILGQDDSWCGRCSKAPAEQEMHKSALGVGSLLHRINVSR